MDDDNDNLVGLDIAYMLIRYDPNQIRLLNDGNDGANGVLR